MRYLNYLNRILKYLITRMSATQITNLSSYEELIAQRNEIERQLILQRSENGIMSVGGTHFKRERDICKRSNYTLAKVLAEFIDNVIKKCTSINIKISINNTGYISEIRVSDNKNNGFENIRKNGTDNPFNFTHMRDGQDDDGELSQNGKGMKGGSVCVSDKMTCITNSNNNDIAKVVCDFEQMANTVDRNESFNPKIFTITDVEYRSEHKLEIGSTIILEKIDGKNIYGKTNEKELIDDIAENIADMYSPILRNNSVRINVNGSLVSPEKDYFEEKECKLFNIDYKLYKIQTGSNDTDEFEYIIEENIPFENKQNHYLFNRETKKPNIIKTPKDKKKYGIITDPRISIEYFNCFSDSKAFAKIKSTSVLYHPDFNNENENDNHKCPKGRARLNLNGRRYGNWNKEGNNGTSNYVDTDIELSSKKIANEIGLTWNKHISNEQKNDISNALREILTKAFSKLNSDTSTTANKKLYNFAIKNGISVPKKRIPTDLRDKSIKPIKKIMITESDDEDDDEDDDSSNFSSEQNEFNIENIVLEYNEHEIREEKKEENPFKTITMEILKNDNINSSNKDNIVYEEHVVEEDVVEENVVEEENSIEEHVVEEHVVEEHVVEEHVVETIVNSDSEEDSTLEPMKVSEIEILPSLYKVQETMRRNLTINRGKELVKLIKENTNGIKYRDNMIKVVCEYADRCARDQIQFILSFNTFEQICDLLIEFINNKYKYANEDSEKLLCGSELCEIYNLIQDEN